MAARIDLRSRSNRAQIALGSRRALAIGVTYSMAIGAIRASDDRHRAWQAVLVGWEVE